MADAKITALTELTEPADADLLAIVDDVSGTATTKKITRDNLFNANVDLNNKGIKSGSFSLNDDTATSFTLPTSGSFMIFIAATNVTTAWGWGRGNAVNGGGGFFSGSGIAYVTDTVLEGTTGADATMSISVYADTDTLYIENRTGTARLGTYLIIV